MPTPWDNGASDPPIVADECGALHGEQGPLLEGIFRTPREVTRVGARGFFGLRLGLVSLLVAGLAISQLVVLFTRHAFAPHPAQDIPGGTVDFVVEPTTTLPSLFCFSVMQLNGYEYPMVQKQMQLRAGIFACEEYVVISKKKVALGKLGWGTVWTWVNPEPSVRTGQVGLNGQTTDSFLNTKVFMHAWGTLIHNGRIWKHDFVVKVDPDAVFFADRLRQHVLPYVGQTVYFANCGKWASGPRMYGAVEVFSWWAMRAYQKRWHECEQMDWHGWGEDYYMEKCFQKLGVQGVSDFNQVGDSRCMGAPCTDHTKAAFHPFKNITEWLTCWSQATGLPWSTSTVTTSTTTTSSTWTTTTTTSTTSTMTSTTSTMTTTTWTTTTWTTTSSKSTSRTTVLPVTTTASLMVKSKFGGPACEAAACNEQQGGCHTCGDRMRWLRSPAGGSQSADDAQRTVASDFPKECGDCHPFSSTTTVALPPAPSTTVGRAQTVPEVAAQEKTAPPTLAATAAPAPATTVMPALTTTAAPAPAATEAPVPAPAPTTRAAPAPTATTAAPTPSTTAPPAPTTTAAPAPTTTAAPAPTTTAPTTTAMPAPTTTAAADSRPQHRRPKEFHKLQEHRHGHHGAWIAGDHQNRTGPTGPLG